MKAEMSTTNLTAAGLSSPWFPRTESKPHAKLRLFCLPYAGGGAMIYRRWGDELPDIIDVCPVQIPGRETRLKEPSFFSLSALVQALAEAIYSRLDMPFALFGHSMGSLLAFELARLIRSEFGLAPAHLFVSGRGAPHTPWSGPVRHTLPAPELMESLRELNGMPEEVLAHAELMGVLLPILRADFSVCETYKYSVDAPLDCPITAFGGLNDRSVTREDLQSWREHTLSAFRLRMIPGDHFFVNSARQVVIGSIAQDLYEIAVNPVRMLNPDSPARQRAAESLS